MTVAQVGTIDWLSLGKEKRQITLTIVDDLDWNEENEHLLLLQEKLNAYLAFVESGDILSHSERLGCDPKESIPIQVSIVAKFEPSERARELLSYARTTFEGVGISLTHRVFRAPG